MGEYRAQLRPHQVRVEGGVRLGAAFSVRDHAMLWQMKSKRLLIVCWPTITGDNAWRRSGYMSWSSDMVCSILGCMNWERWEEESRDMIWYPSRSPTTSRNV